MTQHNHINHLITDNMDVWTSAIKRKSSSGRGSSKKIELYGIKKLRELILELAVRGKLVPQDPNDEPASVLLERIAAEKAQLVKEGKIKKPKKLPEISEEEKPFELPEGWEWSRLGDFVHVEMGQSPASKFYNQNGEGIPFFQGKADFNDIYPSVRYWCVQPQKYAFDGDVLLSVRAPVGPTNISNIVCCIGRGLAALRPISRAPTNYIFYMMQGFRSTLESFATGTTFVAVSKVNVEHLVVSIPPLREQNLIVAKVDELMALCDQLEAQTESSLDAHQTLVTVLLDTLVNSQNAEDLTENWTRISGHFDTLFTTEHSIDQLKQTILQLAVMGNLVPFGEVVNVKLKDLLAFGPKNGFSAKEVSYETELKVLKLGATSYGELNVEESKFIDENIPSDSHLWLKPDDILIQRGNSSNFVGSNIIIKKECIGYIYPDLMMKIRANELIEPSFLSLTLSAPNTREFLWSRMTGTSGTMPKISKTIVESIPVTLPVSRQIQQEIVEKVSLLNGRCDQLKARLSDAQTTQLNLADALVEQAL
ncbi:restriction endonuclease subunit S [Marinomonas shanghaiensis]|uniref:restriction endonuclease subunit S n=1 Tax=Marinomonas shanghaiensis TaxID=2202418 RepID=UPI003A8FAF52